MTYETEESPPTKGDLTSAPLVFRLRLRELRESRGLTARQLAERCQALGLSRITREVIANLETERKRSPDLDELLGLALALGVSPIHLLVPPDPDRYVVGNRVLTVDPEGTEPGGAFEWLCGMAPVDEADRAFWTRTHPDVVRASALMMTRLQRIVEISRLALALATVPEPETVSDLIDRAWEQAEAEETDDGAG